MSFNPFGGFPGTLTAIPHFAMGKFHHQTQEQQHHQAGGNLVAIPGHQGLQIAVSTVDTSQLGQLANGHHHHHPSGQLHIPNQMLNSLLGGGKNLQQQGSENIFIKSETGDGGAGSDQQQGNDQRNFHQLSALQQQQEKNSVQQDFSSLNDYLTRFSGPPTFPFQPMYKYPDLVQAVQINNRQQGDHNDSLLNDSSSQSQSPDLQPQKTKKKKKRREPLLIPGVPAPRRRSTSLQPAISTAADGSTVYGCPQCHTEFNSREAIDAHLAVHRSERPFVCTDCGAALKRKEHLDRHRSSHMTERPHPCPVCQKTFKRIEHLQRHSIIHRTDKVHRCTECGKGFNRKDHLTKHIHSHLAKRIKQEVGQQMSQQPASHQLKAVVASSHQPQHGNSSTINLHQHQSILAHLH